MKIIVDSNEERNLIVSLCDIALKSSGISNLKAVESILSSIENSEKEKANDQPDEDQS